MDKSLPLILLFSFALYSFDTYGQGKSNKSFENSKGKWTIPILKYKGARDNNSSLPYPSEGISFYTDSSYFVKAVFFGTVDTTFITADSSFEVVVRDGDYSLTYQNLVNVKVNKGDNIRTGQLIGQVFKNSEQVYELVLILKKYSKNIDIATWFEWKGGA